MRESGPSGENHEAGLALVEVLVAFAIAALALAALYSAIGLATWSDRALSYRVVAAQSAQSHLDRVVAEGAVLGEQRWSDPGGLAYSLDVQPLRSQAGRTEPRLQPARVVLTVSDARGRVLLTLTTVSFVGRQR